jgi:hypothetical protein
MLNPGDRVEVRNGTEWDGFWAVLPGVVSGVEGERVYVLLDGFRVPLWFDREQVRREE